MFEAYVSGAISVSYLRTTLTRIKLGIPYVDAKDSPWPFTNNDCEMDPPGVAITPRWQGMSRSIEIPAPTIRMRVISANGIHDGDPINGLALSSLITGMCIHTECGNTGLRPYVTWFADLFSAPLSAEQEHAIVVLDTIASYDYWLQVALRNGVIGHDRELHDAYGRAMRQIANAINPDRAPGEQEWTDFLGFES